MEFRGLILLSALLAVRAEGVIFSDTPDPLHNTTTPGDNSGWQYEGKFMNFLGVPVAPHFFITAKHFGGSVGMVFDFHGDSYVTIGFHDDPSIVDNKTTDLRIWEVEHSKPFPTYAPLSSGVADLGATAMIFGVGAQRGVEVNVSAEVKGWRWGDANFRQRWGRNVVSGTEDGGDDYGELLYCDFDKPGIADECHLSVGDSGGGLFVLENGLWRLAGIHLSVDGPFRFDPMSGGFNAALYDKGGLEEFTGDPPAWASVADGELNVPSRFYSSRISASLPWILEKTGHDGSLAPESYSAWQRLYFSPVQIAAPATTGPLADFDADGIGNLLEFALNLDPTFNERTTILSATGLRGLPLVRMENIAGHDHLTVEFVRRTAGSGSGLTYTPQFSSGLGDWAAEGSGTVVAINPRWERVRIVDPLTANDTPRRFARLKLTLVE